MSAHENAVTKNSGGLLVPLLIAILIALFLMTLMPTTMFWDRDEAFYARAAVEMMQSGHWIVPTYNDAIFPEKPPLIYWLMAGSMHLFGQNEFGARFISAPATALSAFLIFLIGYRLVGRRAALWAMVAFASATLAIYLGITAMLDAVLISFICVSLWAFVSIVQSPRYFLPKVLIFGLGIGFSMLAKGPVGPAVVIPAVAITWLVMKPGERPSFMRMVVLAVAALAGLGMFLAWAIPANTMSHGEMLSSGFEVHVLGRALRPMEGHGGKGWAYFAMLPAYIPVILIGFMPATLFLPQALNALFRRGRVDSFARLFLLSWALPGFVLFSLAATKLPHYIVPIFPALALAVGAVIDGKLEGRGLAARIGGWLYLVLTLALAVAFIGGAYFAPGVATKSVLVLLGLFAAIYGMVIFRFHKLERYQTAAMHALISVVIVMEVSFGFLIPRLEGAIKISKPIAEAIQKNFKPDVPVFAAGYLEPSLVFYLDWPVDQPIRRIEETTQDYQKLLDRGGEAVLVATKPDLEAIEALDPKRKISELFRISGWNTNSGGAYQTVIVARVSPKS